jgi:hypothetical protein
MRDPRTVLALLMIVAALMGFAFQAGINKERRDERARWRAWYRATRGQ